MFSSSAARLTISTATLFFLSFLAILTRDSCKQFYRENLALPHNCNSCRVACGRLRKCTHLVLCNGAAYEENNPLLVISVLSVLKCQLSYLNGAGEVGGTLDIKALHKAYMPVWNSSSNFLMFPDSSKQVCVCFANRDSSYPPQRQRLNNVHLHRV